MVSALWLLFPLVALAGEEGRPGKPRQQLAKPPLEDTGSTDPATVDEEDELSDELAFLYEEEIVYTAARHQQDIAESPSAITVITREQIEDTACMDVACLLKEVPEVDVRHLMPSWVAVGARALTGETGDKVLLLVDGMEVNDEAFGMPYWQFLPVHLDDIERIEVIRGPGSALYGANAHSAIVSITSRKASVNGAEAFFGGGEHGSLSLNLGFKQRLGNWSLQLSGGRETSDHWRIRDQSGRVTNRVQLRLTHEAETSTSQLQVGLVENIGSIFTRLGLVNTVDPVFKWNLLLAHQTDLWKAQVYLRTFETTLCMNIPLYYQGIQLGELPREGDVFSSTLDAEGQINWSPWKSNLLIGGANYRWITYLSEINLPEENYQHRIGFFVQDEQRLFDTLILTGGARLDYNNISPTSVSPRLAAVWKFQPDQHLRLAFGRAFRKPSFLNTSLHVKKVKGIPGIEKFFEKSIGNPDLENESITTLELGYIGRFLNQRLTVESDAFYNRYRDTIAFRRKIVPGLGGVPDLNQSLLEFGNEGMEVDSLGGSISLTYLIRDELRLNLNYTLRYSWYVSEPSEYSGEEGEKGDRVPWEPAHLFNASFAYRSQTGPRFGISLHAASSTDVSLTQDGSPFGSTIWIHTPPVYLVNGFFAWRVSSGDRWWELGLRAYNLLHAGFRDTPAVKLPDGSELGGQLIGRKIFLLFRASI